jgi:hypothetical protein
MPELSAGTLVALTLVGLAAGTFDAIAGGGGLLTVPALLAAGLPPHLALGTNKGQSVFGSFAAMVRFGRAGLISRARSRVGFPLGFLGSLLGAALVLAVPPNALRPVVLVLLAAAALFIGLRRGQAEARAAAAPVRRHGGSVAAGLVALAIGAYDGFFGPGTGTFLIVASVAFLGDGLTEASAGAKVVNFASNLAAVILFAAKGVVVWQVALPMAAGQLCGGWMGAHLAVRRGDALVRRVAVLVSLLLAAKVAWDLRS